MKYPTTSDIRDTALSIIADHMEGVKQVDLWEVVEKVMSFSYVIDQPKIKNALWDIDKRFPEYVVKVKKSPKEAIIYPTTDLVKKNNEELIAEESVEYLTGIDDDYEASGGYIRIACETFLQLHAESEQRPLEMYLQLSRDSIANLHRREVEALVMLESLHKQAKEVKEVVLKAYDNIRNGRREHNDRYDPRGN